MKYWTEGEEYPGAALMTGLKPGTFYAYVPSCYLNGISLWVKPVAAVLLERYQVLKQPLPDYENLIDLGDDVIVLGRTSFTIRHPSKEKRYWALLWFDCDSSDCCVAIWETEDDEDEVKAEFARWVESKTHRDQQGEERDLPPGSGCGWERQTDWAWLDVETVRRVRLYW